MTLRAEDFEVDADISAAQGLPAAAFREPAFARLEQDTLFRSSWLLAPVAAPRERGGRAPFTLSGRPWFLQRGWDDDVLRCFSNVCSHAWYPLVEAEGAGRTLVCGQHGRSFDVEGRCKAHKGFSGLPGFPHQTDHLRAAELASLRSLTFVSEGPRAGFDCGALAECVARLPLEKMTVELDQRRVVAGNWKQHAWNYLDRFHIGFIHGGPRGLYEACDMASYTTELHADSALQWVHARRPDLGLRPEHLPERLRGGPVFALWWFVLPNLALNFYPWGLSINVFEPVPERAEVTLFRWMHLVMDEARYARRDELWLSARVDAEDLAAMAAVRRSLGAGELPRGRFAPHEEAGAHWFHRAVYQGVFSAGRG